jgi:multicomponent Na+:H+ antiporter subunit D
MFNFPLLSAHAPLDFIVNFPLFSIILAFVGVVICSLVNRKVARVTTLCIEGIVAVLNFALMLYMLKHDGYIDFAMGHFGAPIGNAIRIGTLEALLVCVFSLVMIGAVLGGDKHLKRDIPEQKLHFFYVLFNLILVALTALIYTNDIFTGYVFLEIATLASIGITMIRDQGRSTIAAVRYMIFNLMGSGLFLIGITLLYDWTGYLSMTWVNEAGEIVKLADIVTAVLVKGNQTPLVYLTFSLITVGLAIKSGLFPFHFWMPDTYGTSTTASSCVLSGLISKGYIILLLKMLHRCFGIENVRACGLLNVLFILGVLGMIIGSYNAIKQTNIKKMIAFSSAAQIGYIYMGIGIGTNLGLIAAFFHILVHAITKPLIFISASRLEDNSKSREFKDLKGAGYGAKLAGITFSIGALSMVGFPVTAGFITKIMFASSSFEANTTMMFIMLGALVVSTILNAIYFIHTMITIYSKNEDHYHAKPDKDKPFVISTVLLVVMNLILGVIPYLIVPIIVDGIHKFM